MNEYTPTLDDIETLVTNHPDKFTSPLQTRRSIEAARGQGVFVEESTANLQYGDYTSNGGTPIGPNGAMPPAQTPASDQSFATPCAVCAAAGGCCIKGIKFKCEHGSDRMTLPLADDTKDAVLVVVCDKETNPTVDKVTIEVDHEPNANCCMPGQVPTLTLQSTPPVTENGIKLETKLQYDFQGETMTGTDLEMFVKATGKSIWSGVNSLGRDNSFEVCACGGGTQWAAVVRTFPKLSWEATDFSFHLEGVYDSSFNFASTITFGGKLKGTYGASEFEISAGIQSDPTQQSKSAVPFLDQVMQRLKSKAGNGGATPERSVRSEVKAEHKLLMASSKLSLVERPDDHTKVGVEAQIDMGFQPLIGISAKFEVIDILLTAAQAYGAPKPFIDAVKKARDWMAREPDPEDAAYLMANVKCDLTFGTAVSLGRSLTTAAPLPHDGSISLSRAISSDTWDATGNVSGEVSVKFEALFVVEGRVWLVKGTLSASAGAESKVIATLSSLTAAEKQAEPDAKFNILVEWTGVIAQVQGSATIGVGGASAGVSGSSQIPVFEPVELYKGTR